MVEKRMTHCANGGIYGLCAMGAEISSQITGERIG